MLDQPPQTTAKAASRSPRKTKAKASPRKADKENSNSPIKPFRPVSKENGASDATKDAIRTQRIMAPAQAEPFSPLAATSNIAEQPLALENQNLPVAAPRLSPLKAARNGETLAWPDTAELSLPALAHSCSTPTERSEL